MHPEGSRGAAGALLLPVWAVVSEKRRAHIERVVALLDDWSLALALDSDEREAWIDAGRWHDALRDAEEAELRRMTEDADSPVGFLHGPAAARRLASEGEARQALLDAIHHHTVGFAAWGRVGRALYMADFLEPGRTFMRADRAFLARLVPTAFDDVFRQVVRLRVEWAVREGKALAGPTVALWNSVR